MVNTILLQIIVFLVPFQLGLHFWPPYSRVMGIKIDYLSPTLYLTEIFIVFYVLLNLKTLIKKIAQHKIQGFILLCFLFLNIFWSIIPQVSLLIILKNIIYLFFFTLILEEKKFWPKIKKPLFVSLVLVLGLEFAQFFLQKSVGGLFYWFGERPFSSSAVGSVKDNFLGLGFVRPQSTFSHPNSLAGYLLLVYGLLNTKKDTVFLKILVFTGLVFTFSKGALIAFLLVFVFKLDIKKILFLFFSICIFQLLVSSQIISLQFIQTRLTLVHYFQIIFRNRYLFGVGVGNFIPALAQQMSGSELLVKNLQPVHNIAFLLTSEIGLFGLFALLFFTKEIKKIFQNPKLSVILSLIIITGLFDHYWFTLIQNKLFALLTIALLI